MRRIVIPRHSIPKHSPAYGSVPFSIETIKQRRYLFPVSRRNTERKRCVSMSGFQGRAGCNSEIVKPCREVDRQLGQVEVESNVEGGVGGKMERVSIIPRGSKSQMYFLQLCLARRQTFAHIFTYLKWTQKISTVAVKCLLGGRYMVYAHGDVSQDVQLCFAEARPT